MTVLFVRLAMRSFLFPLIMRSFISALVMRWRKVGRRDVQNLMAVELWRRWFRLSLGGADCAQRGDYAHLGTRPTLCLAFAS